MAHTRLQSQKRRSAHGGHNVHVVRRIVVLDASPTERWETADRKRRSASGSWDTKKPLGVAVPGNRELPW